MLRSSDIIGNPVISYDAGEQIGKVEDVVFDAVNLIALVIDKKHDKVLYMERVKTLGPDAVIVDNASAIVEAAAVFERQAMTKGLKMMTADAREMGTVADVCFGTDGRIAGYEISSGKLADMVEGRYFVAAEYIDRIGKEVIMATAAAYDAMQNQSSTVKSAVQGMNTAVKKATGTLNEAAVTLKDKLEEVRGIAREKVESVQQNTIRPLRGKVEIVTDEADETVDEMTHDAMQAASDRTRQLYEAIEKKRAELDQAAENA